MGQTRRSVEVGGTAEKLVGLEQREGFLMESLIRLTGLGEEKEEGHFPQETEDPKILTGVTMWACLAGGTRRGCLMGRAKCCP